MKEITIQLTDSEVDAMKNVLRTIETGLPLDVDLIDYDLIKFGNVMQKADRELNKEEDTTDALRSS